MQYRRSRRAQKNSIVDIYIYIYLRNAASCFFFEFFWSETSFLWHLQRREPWSSIRRNAWKCLRRFLNSFIVRCRKARRKEKDAGATEDPKLYLEEAALERQLPELDLRMLVDLPPGLDYNEWLASHTLALFDHINLFYGTISEFCTSTGCPDMTGPGLR